MCFLLNLSISKKRYAVILKLNLINNNFHNPVLTLLVMVSRFPLAILSIFYVLVQFSLPLASLFFVYYLYDSIIPCPYRSFSFSFLHNACVRITIFSCLFSILSSTGLTLRYSLMFSFRSQSSLVTPSTALKYIISVACILVFSHLGSTPRNR